MSTREGAYSQVQAQLLEAASDWFVEFRVGDADADTRKAFYLWLRRSPEHIEAYLQIAQTYADSKALKERVRFEVDDIVARALAESNVVPLGARNASAAAANREEPPEPALRHRPRIPKTASLLAAASVLLAVALGAWYALFRADTYETPIGGQHSVVLDDGSRISMDARSRIRVRLSQTERSIELLAGQALFEVAKDASRPFTVRSDSVLVRAVGTRFDVIQRAGGATVTVIEGQVEVTPTATSTNTSARRILLSAGETVAVGDDAVAPKPVQADIASTTAWTSNRLVFNATPLSEVVEDFNRHNSRQLVLQSEELKALRVTGVFSSTQPDSLIRFLRSRPGVVVQVSESQTTITRE